MTTFFVHATGRTLVATDFPWQDYRLVFGAAFWLVLPRAAAVKEINGQA